ncbi:MAG TPA: hypothetical protein VHQ04_06765 [Puia sp.]|nr:hypothetical protein [Puia sp.]
MKKTMSLLIVGFMSFTALSPRAEAQNSAGPVAFLETKTFRSSIRHVADLDNRMSVLNDIPEGKDFNSKAVRDFHTRFQKVENAMWFSDQNGFMSYFIKNGFGNRVFYDRKGHWEFSLILYTEDQLPVDLRASVKSKYFDLAITLIEEVQTNNGMVYIVHLEDKSNIKILRLSSDAEMEILQELTKA